MYLHSQERRRRDYIGYYGNRLARWMEQTTLDISETDTNQKFFEDFSFFLVSSVARCAYSHHPGS